MGVIDFESLANALAFLTAGIALGFFVRHVVRRHIDGDLITCNEKRIELERDLKDAAGERDEIKPQLESLNKLRGALTGEEDELWRLHAGEMPSEVANVLGQNQPKIVTVMNLKGGVGKTTTVANLAAHFGKQGKRVLAIDLDYQGSLSRMLMLAANIRTTDAPRAIDLLAGEQDPAALQRQVISLHPAIDNVDLISCGQSFDRFENRLMLSWLIGDEKDDVRYRLARVLTSDAFRNAYNLILIDAPPRLSTGAINALATSQVVLIPTVLDRLSAEAVGNFVSRLNHFRPMNAALHYAGVIGTLRGQLGGADVKDGAFEIAARGVANWTGTPYVFKSDIKYFTDLAREAGSNVGYLKHRDVREAYILLADEIQKQLRI